MRDGGQQDAGAYHEGGGQQDAGAYHEGGGQQDAKQNNLEACNHEFV